jgi:sporulation protein YlmC with PRC-barrel domain
MGGNDMGRASVMDASALIGVILTDQDGNDVGEIDDIVIDERTQEVLAIIEPIDMEKLVALNFENLRFEDDQAIVPYSDAERRMANKPAWKNRERFTSLDQD